jgi:RNA polymerase sigma factor (sigma-70 family)
MSIDDVLRAHAPVVLSSLTRKYGQFDACEDATQLALLAASQQWPVDGIPDNPRGWLLTVASRRLVDEFRSESARREREEAVIQEDFSDSLSVSSTDDTLMLLFLCCHPSLSAPSQLALTLRAVGGLTTTEIASAFFVPEATMAQRISRAKQSIKKSGIGFEMPPENERMTRLNVVLQVLYLIFNEGYTTTSGPSLQRFDLTSQAIRLARTTLALLPDNGEVMGLLALMLLTDARREARSTSDGFLVPLEEQDRSLWDAAAIKEGTALVSAAMSKQLIGPYQLQAAIAAIHDEAKRPEDTDWPQIAALYAVLERIAPSPAVTLNRAVAIANVDGPNAGLELIETLGDEATATLGHRVDAVRAHLLERAGDLHSAHELYMDAAKKTDSVPEQQYLLLRASKL